MRNKLSHIRWFEWVVIIILLICILPFCIGEIYESSFDNPAFTSTTLHNHQVFVFLTKLPWLLCCLLYGLGVVLYCFRKRIGWMLLFCATLYMTDIYFRWFFCSESPQALRIYFSLHFFLYLYCLVIFLLPYVRRQFDLSIGHIFLCLLFVLPFIIIEVNKMRLSLFLASWLY